MESCHVCHGMGIASILILDGVPMCQGCIEMKISDLESRALPEEIVRMLGHNCVESAALGSDVWSWWHKRKEQKKED